MMLWSQWTQPHEIHAHTTWIITIMQVQRNPHQGICIARVDAPICHIHKDFKCIFPFLNLWKLVVTNIKKLPSKSNDW